MRFNTDLGEPSPTGASAICRIQAEGIRWRVLVETFEGGSEWSGRLVFHPEGPKALLIPRTGPTALRGRSREEVIAAVHDLPEDRLRQLLHSLG